MATITIKGHEIDEITIKDSFDRRAVQYANKIIKLLSLIGVPEDDIDITVERAAFKNAPASVSWYFDDQHLHYAYSTRSKYVENLATVYLVLELEVAALLEEHKTMEEFIESFREDHDIKKQREAARKTLGLAHDVRDMDVIDKAYKTLAKEHHPDKDTGDTATFKEINRAHKILKRELQ